MAVTMKKMTGAIAHQAIGVHLLPDEVDLSHEEDLALGVLLIGEEVVPLED